MIPDAISEAAGGLFSVCAMVAAMELLIPDGRSTAAFRALCALAMAVRTLRLIARLLAR